MTIIAIYLLLKSQFSTVIITILLCASLVPTIFVLCLQISIMLVPKLYAFAFLFSPPLDGILGTEMNGMVILIQLLLL